MKGLFLVFLIAGLVFCQDDGIVSILLEPVNTDGLMCHQCLEIEGSKMRCSHRNEWKSIRCKQGQACMTNWLFYKVIQRGCYSVRNIDVGCSKLAMDDYVCYCDDKNFCNV